MSALAALTLGCAVAFGFGVALPANDRINRLVCVGFAGEVHVGRIVEPPSFYEFQPIADGKLKHKCAAGFLNNIKDVSVFDIKPYEWHKSSVCQSDVCKLPQSGARSNFLTCLSRVRGNINTANSRTFGFDDLPKATFRHEGNLKMKLQILGWGVSRVDHQDFKLRNEPHSLAFVPHFNEGHADLVRFDVRADLRLPDPLRLVGGSVGGGDGRPRGLQRKGDIDNTSKGDRNANAGGYQEPPSPLRHIPLGYKIALAALMLVGGLYYLVYAFRYVSAGSERDALLYAFLGLGGVFCGVMLSLQAMLGI